MNETVAAVSEGQLPAAILLDGLLQSFCQGIILTQTVKYWYDYTDDSSRKRFFVLVVVFLSVFQTTLEDYKVWRVTLHGQQWSTSALQWTNLFLNGLICSFCQAFFIRRCWKVTNKNNWVGGPLIFFALTTAAANIYLAVSVQLATRNLPAGDDVLKSSRYLLPSTIVAFTYWIFGSLAIDMTLTCILVLYLCRSKTGLFESDQVLSRMITITWETALLPSISMVVAGSLYHATPHLKDHLVLFFAVITGKLYTIGLLRTLNSRIRLRERMKSHDLGRTSLADWQWERADVNTNQLLPPGLTMRSSLGCSPVPSHLGPTELETICIPPVATRIGETASGIQFGSPIIDARERGCFRGHRIVDEY